MPTVRKMTTNMGSIKSKAGITIISCTLIIRVLTLGYVIGGLFIKLYLGFLDEDVMTILNYISLGALQLGDMLAVLFYSLMGLLILYSFIGLIGFLAIYKRTKTLLAVHALGHLLMSAIEMVHIAFLSWILYENYHSFQYDYQVQENTMRYVFLPLEVAKWTSFFQTMKCCGTSGQQAGIAYGSWYVGGPYLYYCSYTEGCLDIIQTFVKHYGILYLVFVSVNTLTSMVAIGATEYMYRTVVINKAKQGGVKKGEQWKCSNGMIGDIYPCIKRSYSLILCIAITIVEVGFGIAIYLYYFLIMDVSGAEYYLGQFYRLGFNMQYIMNGTAYTLMVLIPLSVMLHPVFCWMVIQKKQYKLLYIFVAKVIVFSIGDILLICMSSLIMDLVNDCESESFSYLTTEGLRWIGFCATYVGNVRNMACIWLGFLGYHLVMNMVQAAIVYKMRTRHVKVGSLNDERVLVQTTRILHTGMKKKQRRTVKRGEVPLKDVSSSNSQANTAASEAPANDDEGIETLILEET